MAVIAKMFVRSRQETQTALRPQEHYDEEHGYDCGCGWDRQGKTVAVEFSVVTDGDGDNASFASATPAGSLSLQIDNPKAADYFQINDEVYVEIRKARK